MNRPITFCSCILAYLLTGPLACPAYAGISVSPLKQEIALKPGESAKCKITVSNNKRSDAETARSVRIQVCDVTVAENGSLLFPPAGATKNSASNWITVEPAELTLEPGESRVVHCLVNAPREAVGEYYSAVMVTILNKVEAEKALSMTYRIASGVFVTVEGRSFPKQAKITRCEVVWPEPSMDTASTQPASSPAVLPPARIAAVLQNTGRARFDATGEAIIFDSRSRRVFAAPLISARPCVFGGDSRLFEAPLDRPLAAGSYVLNVKMDYESPWTKATLRQPLEVTPEMAETLLAAQKSTTAGGRRLQPTPDKLSVAVPAGAHRLLKVSLRNPSDAPLRCKARVSADDDTLPAGSNVTVAPAEFTMSPISNKALELTVRLTREAAAGRYRGAVIVEAEREGDQPEEFRIPIEIDLQRR